MKYSSTILFVLMNINLYSQVISNYSSDTFQIVGYHNDNPVFLCRKIYGQELPQFALPWSLYKANTSSGYLVFKLFREVNSREVGRPQFIKDELIGYRKSSKNNTLEVGENKFEFQNDIFYAKYAIYDEGVIVSPSDSKKEYLEQIQFSPTIERIKLPLIGNYPICIGNYIYFSTYHINPEYTHYPIDIYRVKIDDWNNPELLIEEAVESWMPIPNTDIIYTRISIEGNLQTVYYNTHNKTYEITTDRFNSQLIKYDDKYMINNLCKDEATRNTRYCLEELPVFNHTFTMKDNRLIVENLITINLPNDKKSFTDTFITEELLYDLTENELNKLDKEKLRILRNAFYARQGYQFNSKDLQEFFGQFEWYHKMVERNKFLEIANEEVVISPQDKERVDLIFEIENSK